MFERCSDLLSSITDRSVHARRPRFFPSAQTARLNKYSLTERLENVGVGTELNFILSSRFFHVSDRRCIRLERYAVGLAVAGPQQLRLRREHG